jgi:fatty-acyl-CoA synthase
VPDDRWGEVGRAYVTAKKGAVLDTATLDAWCRARLAAYKAPKAYVFAGALPRNALGKVLKHRLDELDG